VKLPAHLTPTQQTIIQKSLDRLRTFNDNQIILLALAQIVDHLDHVAPSLRLPLSINLKERAGIEE